MKIKSIVKRIFLKKKKKIITTDLLWNFPEIIKLVRHVFRKMKFNRIFIIIIIFSIDMGNWRAMSIHKTNWKRLKIRVIRIFHRKRNIEPLKIKTYWLANHLDILNMKRIHTVQYIFLYVVNLFLFIFLLIFYFLFFSIQPVEQEKITKIKLKEFFLDLDKWKKNPFRFMKQ